MLGWYVMMASDSGHVLRVHGTSVCVPLAVLGLVDMAGKCTAYTDEKLALFYFILVSLTKKKGGKANASDNPSPRPKHWTIYIYPTTDAASSLGYADTGRSSGSWLHEKLDSEEL